MTIAVYRERKTENEVLAAVAFEGLGDSLNPSFYPRVLSNLPEVPQNKENQPLSLELDPNATSYLCFYLDHGDLKAGDIAHSQMKQSLGLAIQRSRQQPTAPVAGGVWPRSQAVLEQQQADLRAEQAAANQQADQAQANQQASDAQPASAQVSSDWTTPYWTADNNNAPYYGTDGWIPWYAYVPGYGQQPVIVQPDYRQHHHHRDRDRNDGSAQSQTPASPDRVQNGTAAPARPLNRPIEPPTLPPGTPRPVEPRPIEPRPTTPRPVEPRPVVPRTEGPAEARPSAPARPEPAPAHAEPAPTGSHAPEPAHSAPALLQRRHLRRQENRMDRTWTG